MNQLQSSDRPHRFPLQRSERATAVIGSRRRQTSARVQKGFAFVRHQKVKLSLVLTFFAAHVPLAILMERSGRIATLHAFVTLAGALWLAVFSAKLERVVYAAAYITGSEVLWRMTGADSYWEIGKYGVAAVFIVAMIRHWRVKPSILPILYFALLIPSIFFTTTAVTRPMLSSNLSGPFALMIAGCFFSQLSLSRENLLRLFLAMIGPIIGIAALAVFGITTAESLVFTEDSNSAASGGFGPNQVSAILGLGALASFLILLEKDVDLKLKLTFGGIMLFLCAQSALTFSRGGLYNVVGAIVLASLFLLKDSRTRIQFLLAVFLISTISYFVIVPRLDSFTDGALTARFESTEMTNREEIARVDLEIWRNNPVFGVGPGGAKQYRAQSGRVAAAHTEFTRLLAEHGILGLMAFLVFAGAGVRNVLLAPSAKEKAMVVALMAWSVLFMLNAGMRLVAPSLIYGLAFALVMQRRGSPATTSEVPRKALKANRLVANLKRSQLRIQ